MNDTSSIPSKVKDVARVSGTKRTGVMELLRFSTARVGRAGAGDVSLYDHSTGEGDKKFGDSLENETQVMLRLTWSKLANGCFSRWLARTKDTLPN